MSSNYQHILNDHISYDEATELWQTCDNRNVFNHPGCWRALEESGAQQGQIVSVEVRSSAEDLVAIWPFIIKRGGIRELFLRIAEPVGSRHVDYILPIVSQSETQQVIACLMQGVADILNKYGRMLLPKLVEAEEYTEACNKFIGANYFTYRNVQSSPRLCFSSSYMKTEATLGWGKKHRPSTRIRRLQREGNLNLWIGQSRDQTTDRLAILYGLHRKKWHAEGKQSQFDSKNGQILFTEFVKYLPEDMSHYSELRLNDNVLSCHFGFLNGSWLYWYKPAYDPAYEKFSPGVAHIALLAEYGIEHGWKGIDFLQGDESYKYRWANDKLSAVYLTIATKRNWLWWLWETSVRGYVRRFITRPLHSVLVYLRHRVQINRSKQKLGSRAAP